MPFKSEKQRKWMFANKPEMAKQWSKDYATGGMVKKAIGNVMRLPDLARMRSGGMISNGSKTPKGVVNYKIASCNKFRDS
jgi:hypothetical protein